jgi:hypothetical protein
MKKRSDSEVSLLLHPYRITEPRVKGKALLHSETLVNRLQSVENGFQLTGIMCPSQCATLFWIFVTLNGVLLVEVEHVLNEPHHYLMAIGVVHLT